MVDHGANGTVIAILATGALLYWLNSLTDDPHAPGAKRRQFSLFGNDHEPANAGATSSGIQAAPVSTPSPAPQRPTQAPSVEAKPQARQDIGQPNAPGGMSA